MLTSKFFNLPTYYLKMSRSVLDCWTSYGSDGFTCKGLGGNNNLPHLCVPTPLGENGFGLSSPGKNVTVFF